MFSEHLQLIARRFFASGIEFFSKDACSGSCSFRGPGRFRPGTAGCGPVHLGTELL